MNAWLPTQNPTVEGGRVWPDDYEGNGSTTSREDRPCRCEQAKPQSTPSETQWGGPQYPPDDSYQIYC
ncbi:MAG: hypothetical protein AAB426_04705 [Myxococcota bacterium]